MKGKRKLARQRAALWYQENKEYVLARGREYRMSPDRKSVLKMYQEDYRKTHKPELRVRNRVYRKTHKDEIVAYRKTNKSKFAVYGAVARAQEMVMIAQIHGGDFPRCRADLTPELLDIPCGGALQIDHINGGGNLEKGQSRTSGVVSGQRKLDDLRVLCELHQWAHAILRGDSTGGSDPEEWMV